MHDEHGEIKGAKRKSTRPADLWYKRYPARFRKATSHLPYELRCQYSDLLDLYYEHGGPLPNDDQWISHQLFCDVRKWKHVRKQLIAASMLFVGSDGLLHNQTADEVIEERETKIAKGTVAPKTRRLGRGATPASTTPSTPASTTRGTGTDLSRNANAFNDGVPKTCRDTRGYRSKNEDLREERGLSKEEGSYGWGGPDDPPPPTSALRVLNGGRAAA